MSPSERNKREEVWTVVRGRRRGISSFQKKSDQRFNTRPFPEVWAGNRGVSRHQWWRGPREPPPSGRGQPVTGAVSLFVDDIAKTTSISDLRVLFEYEGTVVDVYIPGKVRKNNDANFGFVRYNNVGDARRAIEKMDGVWLQGRRLKVSMAKYQKGGSPVGDNTDHKKSGKQAVRHVPQSNSFVRSPSLRDHRRYVEVLQNAEVEQEPPREKVVMGNNEFLSLKVRENPAMRRKLEFAAVVKVQPSMTIEQAASMISGSNTPFTCMSSLSPSKILLFFDDDVSLLNALNESSPLCELFPDVRKWSEKECYSERFVWIECVGLNPKCWDYEPFSRIGSFWGEVVRVKHERNGLNSITSAKVLIRTSNHSRIEACVKVVWELGSCVVWVKELGSCSCSCEVQTSLNGFDLRDSGRAGYGMSSKSNSVVRTLDFRVGAIVQNETEKCTDVNDVDLMDANGVNLSKNDDPLGNISAVRDKDTDGGCMSEGCEHQDGSPTVLVTNEPADRRISLDGPTRKLYSNDLELALANQNSSSTPNLHEWFDPIASVECSLPTHTATKSIQQKRPRGRPKRNACSLPEPLFVPSTPSKSNLEAIETWSTAKLLGVTASNEQAVISELRKSKRLLVLEENDPTG
ncbi:unnamed protein product [Amaranthus hypochondriacus]